MYFPNLDELSFRFVLAFPNASKMSFDCSSTFFARSISACPETMVTAAMYLKIIVVVNFKHITEDRKIGKNFFVSAE
jgi:hypothetical protein